MESRLPCWVKRARFQSTRSVGLLEHMKDADEGNDQVEREIDSHENDGDVDCFFKALEEDGAQDGKQDEGDAHLVLQGVRSVGIVDKVGRRVRRRKSHGDDEIGGGKAQQDEHKYFAGPPREQLLEHGDAALAVGAGCSDPIVDGQGCKQRHQNQDQGRDRRQDAGGKESDARLIAEGGEVVHAGEAHHLPPGMLALIAVPVSTLRAFEIREQPIGKRHEVLLLDRRCYLDSQGLCTE